jgi:hypothetical protein
VQGSVGGEAVDSVRGLLLSRYGLGPPAGGPGAAPDAGLDPVGRIGEVDRAVRPEHDVVGTVEPLALESLREDGAGAVVRHPAHPAAIVLCREHLSPAVEGQAIGHAGGVRGQLRALGQAAPAGDTLVRDVAEEEATAAPYRPFRERKPAGHALDGCVGSDEIVQARVLHFQRRHDFSSAWLRRGGWNEGQDDPGERVPARVCHECSRGVQRSLPSNFAGWLAVKS